MGKIVTHHWALTCPIWLWIISFSHSFCSKRQLEAPVANMWRLQGGALQHVDVLWQAAQALAGADPAPPSLYLGVHDHQVSGFF